MVEYLIAFNDEWTGDDTMEELRAKSAVLRPLIAEMTGRGVLIFTGGLDDDAPIFGVDASSGTPVVTEGFFRKTDEHLGGFAVINAADDDEAKEWAGRIAVACGWPQELRRFQRHAERG